jgi:secretion/DNA translocation related CpaE-like protein
VNGSLSDMTGVVVGVAGGSGGVGASSFAAVLADAAQPAVLVDLDTIGGGLDVLLAIEDSPGARWSRLRLDGGRLDPQALLGGLPRWRSVPVLAVDGDAPTPAAALQVVETAAQVGTVVVDLPRAQSALRDTMLRRCDLCVVVARADVRELAATRAVLRSLPDVSAGVVFRRGELSAAEAASLIELPLLGELPPLEHVPPPSRRPSRAATRLAGGVLDGLAA